MNKPSSWLLVIGWATVAFAATVFRPDTIDKGLEPKAVPYALCSTFYGPRQCPMV